MSRNRCINIFTHKYVGYVLARTHNTFYGILWVELRFGRQMLLQMLAALPQIKTFLHSIIRDLHSCTCFVSICDRQCKRHFLLERHLKVVQVQCRYIDCNLIFFIHLSQFSQFYRLWLDALMMFVFEL